MYKRRCAATECPFNKACNFELALGWSNTYCPINAVWIIRKAKKTSTEGDKVNGVNKARTRIHECVTASALIIRAAFEPGEFKIKASQECISMATVMTLRTISSVDAFLCFARVDAHRYTGSLDRFGSVIWLIAPPFHNLLQLFLQNVLFVLR